MKSKRKTHAARLGSSARLCLTADFLATRGARGATTMEIARHTNSLGVSTDIWELRCNGVKVDCAYERTAQSTRRRVYRYTLTGSPKVRP